MRVAFVPRSAEIQPLFWRFVTFIPPLQQQQRNNNPPFLIRIKIQLIQFNYEF